MRSAGSHSLSRFCAHLEGAKFREELQVCVYLVSSMQWLLKFQYVYVQTQILMLIEVLRNSLEMEGARLPSLFAVFVVKTASLFLYPGTHWGIVQHVLYM